MLDSTAQRRRARFFAFSFALAVILIGTPLSRASAQSAPGSVPLAPQSPPPPPAPGSISAPSQAAPTYLTTNDPRNPLHLTRAQQERRNAIITRYEPQIQAILRNQKLSQQDKKTKLTAIFAQANTQLEAILTPSQHAANDKLRKEAAARQAQMMAALNGRRAQLQKMEKQFEATLTADQKKKLNALSASARQQLLKLQADKSLTAQQKQQKYMALGQSYTAAANKVYTPAQQTALRKIREAAMKPLGSPAGH